jgi:hypothetical protein
LSNIEKKSYKKIKPKVRFTNNVKVIPISINTINEESETEAGNDLMGKLVFKNRLPEYYDANGGGSQTPSVPQTPQSK